MSPKSSKKSRDHILGVISVQRAESLLLDWVNLPKWKGQFAVAAARFHRQEITPDTYALELAPTPTPSDRQPAYEIIVRSYPEVFADCSSELSMEIARIFADLLRKAWDAVDLRKREWYLSDAEAYYHRTALGRFGDPTEQATALEAVLFHFRRNAARALHCPNINCSNPYFLSSKKGQKFCSRECAEPARKESKRRWWSLHGAKKREGAKKDAKKSQVAAPPKSPSPAPQSQKPALIAPRRRRPYHPKGRRPGGKGRWGGGVRRN